MKQLILVNDRNKIVVPFKTWPTSVPAEKALTYSSRLRTEFMGPDHLIS